ncbi:MAG: putative secreted protein [Candidatus Phytoplasma cynodontis]|nr:MAG: putative secreted protein [Candidatus Phytoplasma cynodontis]
MNIEMNLEFLMIIFCLVGLAVCVSIPLSFCIGILCLLFQWIAYVYNKRQLKKLEIIKKKKLSVRSKKKENPESLDPKDWK